jgi:hypothetical protein
MGRNPERTPRRGRERERNLLAVAGLATLATGLAVGGLGVVDAAHRNQELPNTPEEAAFVDTETKKVVEGLPGDYKAIGGGLTFVLLGGSLAGYDLLRSRRS